MFEAVQALHPWPPTKEDTVGFHSSLSCRTCAKLPLQRGINYPDIDAGYAQHCAHGGPSVDPSLPY